MITCRVCGEKCRTEFTARERMLELGDSFTYGQCEQCGSLSLAKTPADLGKYYPAGGYYSFNATGESPPAGIRHWIWDKHLWMAGARPVDTKTVRRFCPRPDSRILDVGSGSGRMLHELWRAGYRDLCGIDPFLPPERVQDRPFPLRQASVADAGGNWDMIMYHHVLEHVPDPGEEMKQAAAQLRPGGFLLIRVPLADSWAFKHYGPDWVQLDAPRHLSIASRHALVAAAGKCGLKIETQFDDSTAFQTWASRIYTRTTHSFKTGDNAYVRSARNILRWFPALVSQTLFSAWLNLVHRGDQGCFVFRKT